ncbi:ATP-binding protein [Gemmatimonas phototrophica]|uniref:ATP-binding protein n=1 Tax=Gemmatimonas phototrophica TaxID=1379270 RepID=UPI0006A72EE0|nr:ATP-binding protein [Gemmatimonas phototrophica]
MTHSLVPSPVAPSRLPLGRVVATERKPNTPHEFHFWTAIDAPIGIGTIVRVEGTTPVESTIPQVYGVVMEGFSYSDLQSPLHDVLGYDGQPAGGVVVPTDRTEIRLYTAQVLRHLPEEPLQPVPLGRVYLAEDHDVAMALRMDGYIAGSAATGIPVGVYRAGGMKSPIFLDADFLVGPEAAHLNISGVSGLATKTSAIEWLLQSTFAHFPSHRGTVAAVCFNVKGPDLCFLDQPGTLEESDRDMYELLGVPPTPFQQVRYFAPYTARGYALNTLRSNEALADTVTPLTWGLSEVLQFAEVLLNKDDVDAKADALIDFIRERVVGKEFDEAGFSRTHRVHSFADLDAWFREVLRKLEDSNGDTWRTHHAATIRKVRNRLSNLSTRCAGLVTDDGLASDLPFGSFEDRVVYVVDVANVEEDAQNLVFARVVSKLREHLERRDLGVDHVIVFVDELNKYAPHDGPETYVRKMLLDIAERGRYLGLVLFGAEQFRSQVHRRVVGNAGTTLYGRMDADELATPGYQVLSPAVKARLATLDKGQLMVRHPHFTQPVFIRFPRPAVMTGREGVERFPQAPEPTAAQAVTRDLRRLDPSIELGWVQQTILLYDEPVVLAARNAVMRTRPDAVKSAFVRELQRRAVPTARDAEAVVHRPRAIRPFSADEYGG